jgi:hypothetical protein
MDLFHGREAPSGRGDDAGLREPEHCQSRPRPPNFRRVRRFRHHEPPAGLKQRRGTFCRRSWGAEEAGDHDRVGPPHASLPTNDLGAGANDRYSSVPIQGQHGATEESGPPGRTLDQGEGDLRKGVGQDEAGQSCAGAQIGHAVPRAERTSPRPGGFRKPQGVDNVWLQRAGTDEALMLRFLQDLQKSLGDGRFGRHRQSAGAITTCRAESSPSERVTRPSISVTVSCTTLRSAGDMGSRARSAPDSRTSAAIC